MFQKNKLKNSKLFSSKKSQIFIGIIVVGVILGLLGSWIFLNYQFSDKSKDEHLGVYQSAMIDALISADKFLIYNELSGKYSSQQAAYDLAENGGMAPEIIGGDAISSETKEYACGAFGYNLWSTSTKKCFIDAPNFVSNAYKYYLNQKINFFVATYSDESIKKDVETYEVSIQNQLQKATVFAFAQNSLEVPVFKNVDYLEEGIEAGYFGKAAIYGVDFNPAPPTNYDVRYNTKIDTLVIHYTAGSDISGALSRLLKINSQASAHYVLGNVKDKYKLIQIVDEKYAAYHAGCKKNSAENCRCVNPKYYNINSRSIGIEVVNLGNYCGKNQRCMSEINANWQCTTTSCWEIYPDEQWKKLVALSAIIVKKYNIPIDREHIIGHYQIVPSTCKVDPGDLFNWDKFMKEINDAVLLDDDALIAIIIEEEIPSQTSLSTTTTPTTTQLTEPQQSKQEIEEGGLLGTYYFKPSFSTEINFDFNLYGELIKFADKTMDDCRISDQKKEDCLNEKTDEFNEKISSQYLQNNIYVNLAFGAECDANENEKFMYSFVEELENCFSSTDSYCECYLEKNKFSVKATSSEDTTTFTYSDSNIGGNINSNTQTLDMYHPIYFWSNNEKKSVNNFKIDLTNAIIYKNKDSFEIKAAKEPNVKNCQVIKNKYRLCLKTNYTIPEINKNKIVDKNITIKFALTIRDNIPPKITENVELQTLKHSKNSIIVSWDKAKEQDVTEYKIYLADTESQLTSADASSILQIPFRTLDVRNSNYYLLNEIDMNQEPECQIAYYNNKDTAQNDPYCLFKYTIKDANNQPIQITLEKNKLYFDAVKNKFIYVLDGNYELNSLTSDKEKFIAVTAVDADLNEDITFISGKNTKSILPKDYLEAGIVKPAKLEQPDSEYSPTGEIEKKLIKVVWEPVSIYIDGILFNQDKQTTQTQQIPQTIPSLSYAIYSLEKGCDSGTSCDITKLEPVKIMSSSQMSETIEIDKDKIGNYYLAITAVLPNNNDLEYKNMVFVQSIDIK